MWLRRSGLLLLPSCRSGRCSASAAESSHQDLVIFEGDAEVKKVPQCTTGRVILLEFAGSSNRNFFWLQVPHAIARLNPVTLRRDVAVWIIRIRS